MTKSGVLVETAVPQLARPATIFDLLNFRLSEIQNVSGSMVTRLCEGEFGITRDEWALIAIVAAIGPSSPSDLAAQTTVDRSQLSRTLKALIEKKLAVRETVPEDQRRALVRLTDSGRALYRRGFPRVVAIHHEVLADLSAAERRTLARCIVKMQARAMAVERSGIVRARATRRDGGSRKTWSPPSAE